MPLINTGQDYNPDIITDPGRIRQPTGSTPDSPWPYPGGTPHNDFPTNQGPIAPANPTQPTPSNPPTSPYPNPAYDANVFSQGLTGLYQKYYGRNPTADELAAHRGNPGGLPAIEQMLAATPHNALDPAPAAPAPTSGAYAPSGAYIPPATGTATEPGGGFSPGPAAPGVTTPQTSVFSDPATQQYEQMLNQMMAKLNTPYTPPDMAPALDYLKSYFQQLQGPAYTPQQLDVMQTQALDPLERQRQAARQQVTERLASRGIPPSSGIVEKALENVDNQFNTIRAQTQSGFATNAINTQKQQFGQAAQLGPQIAALEAGNYNYNLGNQQQATQMGSIIPQLAWQRLTGSNSLIQPISASPLISQLLGAQQTGYTNSANYTNGLMQLLMQLVGAG